MAISVPQNWLITGGCGFIGKRLVGYLLHRDPDIRVRVLDNLSVGTRGDLAKICHFRESNGRVAREFSGGAIRTELVVGDIRDPKTCVNAAQGADIIVHLAANTGVGPSVEDPRADMETNVAGTLNMLEAARQRNVRRFVFASSGAPVGECEPPIHEELPCHPVSPYGASKLAGEGYCSAYYRSFGIETVALRFGNVYGPGSDHKSSVVAKFIRQALAGEPLEIYGDGNQTRDFIYIDDLVRAIWLAATTDGIGGEVFQIATNSETTVNELAEQLVSVLAEYGVNGVRILHGESRVGDVRRNYSDTGKVERMLNWKNEIHLSEGINRIIFIYNIV